MRQEGIEPSTPRLKVECSTSELLAHLSWRQDSNLHLTHLIAHDLPFVRGYCMVSSFLLLKSTPTLARAKGVEPLSCSFGDCCVGITPRSYKTDYCELAVCQRGSFNFFFTQNCIRIWRCDITAQRLEYMNCCHLVSRNIYQHVHATIGCQPNNVLAESRGLEPLHRINGERFSKPPQYHYA